MSGLHGPLGSGAAGAPSSSATLHRAGQATLASQTAESDDAASIASKHSLKTLPGGHAAGAPPSPSSSPTTPLELGGSSGAAGSIGLAPVRASYEFSSDDDDDPPMRNTITASRNGGAALPRPYADSDDEAHWTDLSGSGGRAAGRPTAASVPPLSEDGATTVRITVNDVDDEADAETKAMIMQERRRVLVRVGSQLLLLFLMCFVALFSILWLGLPEIEDADRAAFKIPRSFEELKALNGVLQHYKTSHAFRVFICWQTIYIFLQAFSLPGSMYLSILAGAIWGVARALPIVVLSVATGATVCYLLSRQMGEVLVAVPSWKMRVDSWRQRISEQDNLFSYLVFIRHLPLPPHWVVNLIAPHLGIGIPMFWLTTAAGVTAVSFIHVTIGAKLDEMTSPEDFHLISWGNFFLLAGVCLAVMTPILVQRFSGAAPLEEPDGPGAIVLPGDEGERVDLAAAGTARQGTLQRVWANLSGRGRPHAAAGAGAYSGATLRPSSPLYDEDSAPSEDELPSLDFGKRNQGVRIAGAEDTSSPWRPAGAGNGAAAGTLDERDADEIVQNPFDSDADEDDDRLGPRRRARGASTGSKAARTLGIGNVTGKAAKVLGMAGGRR